MKHAVEETLYIVLIVGWLAGVVLASGWWKALAVCLPFYAWYLIVERAMQAMGVV